MPFANLTGDPSKDYLGDGMAEELINVLAKVPGTDRPFAHLVVRLQGSQHRPQADREGPERQHHP